MLKNLEWVGSSRTATNEEVSFPCCEVQAEEPRRTIRKEVTSLHVRTEHFWDDETL